MMLRNLNGKTKDATKSTGISAVAVTGTEENFGVISFGWYK